MQLYNEYYPIRLLTHQTWCGRRNFHENKIVLYIFAAMTVLLALAVAPVAAAGNANFVNLVAKDQTWTPVDGGGWGKMMYKFTPKPMFEFNGHGLVAGTDYALISYAESGDSNILGYGTADTEGNVHIAGRAVDLIYNTYTTGEYADQTGAKIWLVVKDDLFITGATGNFDDWSLWSPAEYLFETALVPMPV